MRFFKISREEKSIQVVYLAALWFGLSVFFFLILFRDFKNPELRGKEVILEEINDKEKIRLEQKLNLAHVDSLKKMLGEFNPENKQAHLESKINYQLGEFIKTYQSRKDHPNYKVYIQIKTLYGMLYNDKKAIWHTEYNNKFLKKNLEDCEVGFQQTQNNISLQEALKNNMQTP